MAGNPKQKLKLLYLAEILHRETDESAPLSAGELCERLKRYGITAGRKSIYSDIRYLREFGLDIIAARSPRPGFFLAARRFEPSEVQLLVSAVQASPTISPKKSEALVEKLLRSVSVGQAAQLRAEPTLAPSAKSRNEELYYSIDEIGRALRLGRQIGFRYLCRRIERGEARSVWEPCAASPYALLWRSDRYFLICRRGEEGALSSLRVDRMKKVKALDAPALPCSESGAFDAADYAGKMFCAAGGELRTIELRCKNSMIETILDRFGLDLTLLSGGSDSFIIKFQAMAGEGMLSWLMRLGPDVELLGPQDLRREMLRRARALERIYSRPPVGYRFL